MQVAEKIETPNHYTKSDPACNRQIQLDSFVDSIVNRIHKIH